MSRAGWSLRASGRIALVVGMALSIATAPAAAQVAADGGASAAAQDAAQPDAAQPDAASPSPLATEPQPASAPALALATTAPPLPPPPAPAPVTAPPPPRPQTAQPGPRRAAHPAGSHGHAAMTLSGRPGHGVTLTTGDDLFAMTLRGRAMLRDTLVIPSSGAGITNEISVRRARVVLSGHTFSRNVQYYMQLAFGHQDFEPESAGPQSRVPLLDAYVTLTHLRDLHVRVGQFITPFDRARVISSSAAQMVDRSIVVSELNLDRDIGVQLFSPDLFGLNGVLRYQLGVFSGEGRNRLAADPSFLYVARLEVAPFGRFDDYVEGDLARAPNPRLAIGVGGAFNHGTTRQRSTTGNPYHLGPFDYAHAEADVMFKWAGFSLLAEVLYRQALGAPSHAGMHNGAMLTEWARSGWGYFVQAGYALTPHLEASARFSQLLAITPTDPQLETQMHQTGHELGGAFSWYVQGHALKLQADYFYLFGDVFEQGRHQVRLQMQASF